MENLPKTPKIFIVRFAGWHFFTKQEGGVPLATYYPGQATAMSYFCAFDLAQELREFGFSDAVVCLPEGVPAGVGDIHVARDTRTTDEFSAVWGEQS
jgi:hypothetical protein